MKHIKTFEKLKNEFKIGDQIVLIHADAEDIRSGFIEGRIYTIDLIDADTSRFNTLPYYVVNKHHGSVTWFSGSQIRRATSEDITVNKYNL